MDRTIPPKQIVLYGPSFGGGATCELARRVQPAAVVLESTFLSIADASFADYPRLPANWLIRHRFANKDKVAFIPAPLLIIHSRDDTLYPFRHGQELFRRARAPKQFLEIFGDHYEGAVMSGDLYYQGWERFLAPILPRPSGKVSGA